MCHHVKKLMYTVDVGEPDPRCGKMLLEQFGGAIGLIEPTPKFLDQYFNTSTGEGDYGEKDLLGPWNEEDVERVDAAALQSFLDPKIGTRASEPSDAPDLAAPTDEAAPPTQMDSLANRKSTERQRQSEGPGPELENV